MSALPQGNMQPGQMQQVNPVVLANELYIDAINKLNIMRDIVMQLATQLDQIKRPSTQGPLLEFDAQNRKG